MKSAGAQTSKKLWTPPTFSWHLPVISKEINKNPAYRWASVCFLIPNRPFFPQLHSPVHPGEPCTHPGAWNCSLHAESNRPVSLQVSTDVRRVRALSHTHIRKGVFLPPVLGDETADQTLRRRQTVERSCESITKTWCGEGEGSVIRIHFVLMLTNDDSPDSIQSYFSWKEIGLHFTSEQNPQTCGCINSRWIWIFWILFWIFSKELLMWPADATLPRPKDNKDDQKIYVTDLRWCDPPPPAFPSQPSASLVNHLIHSLACIGRGNAHRVWRGQDQRRHHLKPYFLILNSNTPISMLMFPWQQRWMRPARFHTQTAEMKLLC